MSGKSILIKELASIREGISLLQSIFPVKEKQRESSGLDNIFKSRIIGNPHAQGELFHHFEVPVDCPFIYIACKHEKGTIWHMMDKHVLDASNPMRHFEYCILLVSCNF